MNENCNKNEKIKALQVIVSPETLKLLQILFKELNICTVDLDALVTNCIDIYNGANIDVCKLLGTDQNKSKIRFSF